MPPAPLSSLSPLLLSSYRPSSAWPSCHPPPGFPPCPCGHLPLLSRPLLSALALPRISRYPLRALVSHGLDLFCRLISSPSPSSLFAVASAFPVCARLLAILLSSRSPLASPFPLAIQCFRFSISVLSFLSLPAFPGLGAFRFCLPPTAIWISLAAFLGLLCLFPASCVALTVLRFLLATYALVLPTLFFRGGR